MSQTASFADWHMAMYSASVDESATEVCFFVFHGAVPSPIRKIYALIDFLSSRSPPQSESESVNPAKSATAPPRLKLHLFVPLRYRKMRRAASK